MNSFSQLSRHLAVRGVFWRECLDWIVVGVPSSLHPFLIFATTLVFYVVAAPARRTVVRHLGIILPGSGRVMNCLRAFRVFQNFGWTLTDAAAQRLLQVPFTYEVDGHDFLDQLAVAQGAIVLTAHMGNYNLGAAVFVEKFQREIRMVRAPEPDALTARHLDRSIEQLAAGAVKVDYTTDGTALSFDLLNALRRGEIISIQGDRVIGEVTRSTAIMFNRQALLPTGPFVLALAAQVPIFPLFIIRAGFRRYKIVARAPITCVRSGGLRDADIATAMQQWANVLAQMISNDWRQWHAFTPVFSDA